MDRIQAITLVGELEDVLIQYDGKDLALLKRKIKEKFEQILKSIDSK